jgi:polyisoprenoid-binding protein YceI
MKKITIVAAALFFLANAAFAQSWTWDKPHSQLNFNISHLGIATIAGTFNTVDAKVTASKDDFSDAVIELTADVNSINTNNEQRNTHLKTADFFDAAKYPTLTFKSTSFTKTGDKTYKLEGDLTFHGVTKHEVLDVVYNGTITHPMTKKLVAGFKITGIVKRSDFNLAPSFSSNFLGDDVALNASSEFVKD